MRLSIEHRAGKTVLAVYDKDRVVASASGDSAPEAARFLLQQVDRIAAQTRDLLVDAGLEPSNRGKPD